MYNYKIINIVMENIKENWQSKGIWKPPEKLISKKSKYVLNPYIKQDETKKTHTQ